MREVGGQGGKINEFYYHNESQRVIRYEFVFLWVQKQLNDEHSLICVCYDNIRFYGERKLSLLNQCNMMTTQYDTSGYVAEIDTYMRTLTVPFSRGGSSLLSPSPPIVEHPELETRDDSVIASDDTRSPSPEEIGLPSSTNNKSSSFQKLTKHPSPRQDMEQNLPSGSQEQTADSDLIRGMKPHRFSDRSIDDIKEVHRLKIGAGDDSAKRSRSVSNVLQVNNIPINLQLEMHKITTAIQVSISFFIFLLFCLQIKECLLLFSAVFE